MYKLVGLFVWMSIVSVATPVVACSSLDDGQFITFDEVQSIPQGAFAARVKIVKVRYVGPDIISNVKIIEVLSPHKMPKKLVVITQYNSSCDADPQSGDEGIVMGDIIKDQNGEIIIQAYRAPPIGMHKHKER